MGDRELKILRGKPSLMVSLGPRFVFIFTIGLVIANVGRAVDYVVLHSDEWQEVQDLTLVERAAPLWMWSIVLVVCSAMVVVGSLDPPRLRTLIAGHIGLFLTNAMIGVGSIAQRLSDPQPGGWRIGLALLGGVAAAHFLLAVATETRRQALLAIHDRS